MFVVRKIDRAKWGEGPDLGNDTISADAVTINLKTKADRLSFWLCPSDGESEIDEVVLAFASRFKRPDKIDIALIDKSMIEKANIVFEQVSGDTHVTDLQDHHLDAINLNLDNIIVLANYIADAVRNKNHYKRYQSREVLRIVIAAIQSGRLNVDKLEDKMRQDVEKMIEPESR